MTAVGHRWTNPGIISRDEKEQRSKESKVVKPNLLPDKVLTSEPILKPPEAIKPPPNTVLKPEVTTEIKSINEQRLEDREKMSPEERFNDSLRRWRQGKLKRKLKRRN